MSAFHLDLKNGCEFLHTKNIFKTAQKMDSEQKDKKLVITFAKQGETRYKNFDDKLINFKSGFMSACLFGKIYGVRKFDSGTVEQSRIIVDEKFLQRNLKDSVLDKFDKRLNIIKFCPIDVRIKMLFNEINQNLASSELDMLFLQGKILQILALALKEEKSPSKITLDEYDKKAIFRARDILISSLDASFSLAYLAKAAHISEMKLKFGFKQIFATSPYKYRLTHRLNIAKQMLQSGEYNVDEVAKALGYKYANNFSKAFFKELKILPKDAMKSAKYY